MFNAQTYADKIQKEVPVKWRSYRTVIKPNQPMLRAEDLEKALKEAKAYQLKAEKQRQQKAQDNEDEILSQSILQSSSKRKKSTTYTPPPPLPPPAPRTFKKDIRGGKNSKVRCLTVICLFVLLFFLFQTFPAKSTKKPKEEKGNESRKRSSSKSRSRSPSELSHVI